MGTDNTQSAVYGIIDRVEMGSSVDGQADLDRQEKDGGGRREKSPAPGSRNLACRIPPDHLPILKAIIPEVKSPSLWNDQL